MDGGISGLLRLIGRHRGAFAYDWRTRFGVSLSVIGTEGMSLAEALLLFRELMLDPTSHVFVAVNGWQYPAPLEALAVWNLFDLTHELAWLQGGKKGQKPKPHPRPSDKRPVGVTVGRGTRIPVEEFASRWDELVAKAQARAGTH